MNTNLKSPVIVHLINSLEGGGTERVLVDLLGKFRSTDLSHAVVTLREAGSLTDRLPDHVSCYPLSTQGQSRLTGVRLALATRRLGACVLHARNTGCWADAIVASMLRPLMRVVLGFHGLDNEGPFSRRQRLIARWGYRLGATFTTVSKSGAKQISEQTGIPRERIEVLPNGVDRDRFRGSDQAARRRTRCGFGFTDDAFVALIVGSLTPVKGHADLIRAIIKAGRNVPELRLLIVGEGELRSSLEMQARRAGVADRVVFTGWRDDIHALLNCSDAYVCASRSEEMSNAVLQALASGLPVVSTDVGDHGEIVSRFGAGRVVEVGDDESMACSLVELAIDLDVRRDCAAAARVTAQAYTFDDTVRAYESYYRTLVSSRDRELDSSAGLEHAMVR